MNTNPIDYWYQKYQKEKAKKEKLKRLGQDMYNRMFNPNTNCTGIRDAMKRWQTYIIELNKED